MNYITEINKFYDWLETNPVSDSSIVLWHALMHINNKCGWKQQFAVAISSIQNKTGFSKSSILRARNILNQNGRLNFISRNGQQSAIYSMIAFHTDTQGATQSGTQTAPQSGAQSGTQTVPILKLNKTKQNSIVGHAPTDRKKDEKKIFKPPLLEDVRNYFLKTIGNAKNSKSWPPDKCANEAGQFFDHYTANGWVQNKGKPIKDWQAACRNWIRNDLKGAFSPAVFVKENKSDTVKSSSVELKNELSKVEKDVNELYQRFLQNESHVTIISTDTVQYDLLKKSGMINFSHELIGNIKKEAVRECNGNANEKVLLSTMKKMGVIEFFKEQKNIGKKTVFI